MGKSELEAVKGCAGRLLQSEQEDVEAAMIHADNDIKMGEYSDVKYVRRMHRVYHCHILQIPCQHRKRPRITSNILQYDPLD